MDQGVQIDVIYTDFEKAFDKVPHLGLISKLKACDIESLSLPDSIRNEPNSAVFRKHLKTHFFCSAFNVC